MFKVFVYTKPGCMPCRAVKRSLTASKVLFEEVPITEENRAEIAAYGFSSAPIVIMEDVDAGLLSASFSGFNPEKVKKLCDIYHNNNPVKLDEN